MRDSLLRLMMQQELNKIIYCTLKCMIAATIANPSICSISLKIMIPAH